MLGLQEGKFIKADNVKLLLKYYFCAALAPQIMFAVVLRDVVQSLLWCYVMLFKVCFGVT